MMNLLVQAPTWESLPWTMASTVVISFLTTVLVSKYVSRESYGIKEACSMYPWEYAVPISLTQPLHYYIMAHEFFGYDSQRTSLHELFVDTVLCLFVVDASLYWGHWIQHRYFMCFHHVHHSLKTDKNMTTIVGGYTASLVDTCFMQLLVLLVPPMVLSLHPLVHWVITVWTGITALALHGEAPSGFTSAVFITPDDHRMHHMTDTSQKNYSMLFKFWDQFMGTYSNPHPIVFLLHSKKAKSLDTHQ